MTTNDRLVFVVTGPSCAGKTTVCNMVNERIRDLHIAVSHTTRPRRDGENDGIDYHFVSERVFGNMMKKDKLIEHAEVYGNMYGLTWSEIIKPIEDGFDVLAVLDVQGYRTVKSACCEARVVGIFFDAPDDAIKERSKTRKRGQQKDDIEKRLAEANAERENIHDFDYYVMNDGTKVGATLRIASIVMAERCRIRHV